MTKDIVLTEEEQIEQTKKWLKNNLPSIFIGIGLGLALIFGYNYYQAKKLDSALAASSLYETIIKSDNAVLDASKQFDTFKKDYSSTPYAAKIALLSAKHDVENSNNEGALDKLTWAIDNSDEELVQQTAILRKAKVLSLNEQFDAAEKLLNDNKSDSLASFYSEALGDIAMKKSEYKKAVTQYEEAILSSTDPRYGTYLSLKLNKATSLQQK